jgi:uncharacterized protein (UPF0303 family)
LKRILNCESDVPAATAINSTGGVEAPRDDRLALRAAFQYHLKRRPFFRPALQPVAESQAKTYLKPKPDAVIRFGRSVRRLGWQLQKRPAA